MTLPLTPERIEAAYEYLRTTPPFNGWRLPDGDTISFRVSATKHMAHYTRTEHHIIAISARRVGSTNALMHVLAHEMVHLHQAVVKTETANTEHNAAFDRLAKRVCRIHGWDWKEFHR